VVLQEFPATSTSTLICTAEGGTNPSSVYWLGTDSRRIDTVLEQIGRFRTQTSLNISDASQATTYQCCVKQTSNTFCKKVETRDRPNVDITEEKSVSIWERQEKITIGLICGGIALAIVIAIVVFVCYRRRKRAKKMLANGNAEPTYTAVETAPKPKGSKSKQPTHDVKDRPGKHYTAVEFEPKAGTRKSRPKKADFHGEGESSNYTSVVRVRPVSNPRYANCL